MREAIEYRCEQVRRERDQKSGRIELEARAFAEMEKNHQASQGFELVPYGLDLVVADGCRSPTGCSKCSATKHERVSGVQARSRPWPNLVLTLTATQLGVLTNNKPVGAALLAVFDQASKMDDANARRSSTPRRW